MFIKKVSNAVKMLATDLRKNYRSWSLVKGVLYKTDRQANQLAIKLYDSGARVHLVMQPEMGLNNKEEKYLIEAVKECISLLMTDGVSEWQIYAKTEEK